MRPGRGDLRPEEERRRREVDRVEEHERRGQRRVDDADAEALDPLEDHPGDERDREQQQGGDDRTGEGITDAKASRRHEAVEEQHDGGRHEQRRAGADALLQESAVEPEGVERLLDPTEHDGLGEIQEHDDEHERGGADDQDEVDELSPDGWAATLHSHRDLEAGAEGRHHPRGRPREHEQADEAERRCGRCQLLDLPRHVGAAALGERERVDDLRDHLVLEARRCGGRCRRSRRG